MPETAAEIAVPLALSRPVMVLLNVITGAEVVPPTVPARPLAVATDKVFTPPPTKAKSEPFHATIAAVLEETVTPVVAAPLMTTAALDWLTTTYSLLEEGAMMLRDTPGVPVGIRMAMRDWLAKPEPVVDNVQFAEVTLAVVKPAMALSTNEVMLSLTTSPHAPSNSPSTGSANPSRGV